ncbi:MAG: hypothetical protein HQL64_16835 [Magnetococcales bacterium]|nr:hypothetical protein [Magnetococcales bacterium]
MTKSDLIREIAAKTETSRQEAEYQKLMLNIEIAHEKSGPQPVDQKGVWSTGFGEFRRRGEKRGRFRVLLVQRLPSQNRNDIVYLLKILDFLGTKKPPVWAVWNRRKAREIWMAYRNGISKPNSPFVLRCSMEKV